MKDTLLAFFFCLSYSFIWSQELDSIKTPSAITSKIESIIESENSNLKKRIFLTSKIQHLKKLGVNSEPEKANYLDYKIIDHFQDTTLVDTTLTISKEYKMNYLRKDLFGLHSFENQGQVFTKLTHSFNNPSIVPKFGAIAKHINYYEIEDIKYYEVPTPTSEFFYKSGLDQGQVLDSWLAMNTHRNLNFSLAYKGLRSLGNYRNSLSSHVNFRSTISYRSNNKRYQIRAHYSSQNLMNQENGGLTTESLTLFDSNHSDFKQRGRLDVNLEDANSRLIGKRYYFNQNYTLSKTHQHFTKKITDLKLGHVFTYETKQYHFNSGSTSVFEDQFKTTTTDKTSYKTMNNQIYLDFTAPYVMGNFRVLANYYSYFQGYKAVALNESQTIPNQLKGNLISAGAHWNASVKNIYFSAKASTAITGDLTGSNLFLKASFKNADKDKIGLSLQLNSKSPNFQFLFFQSNHKAYNWRNHFKNIRTRNLNLYVNTKWIETSVTASQIENFTYFNDASQPFPNQYNKKINYFKVKVNHELKIGYFALNNTFLYQKAATGATVFKVPEFVGRSTFYFSKKVFKKKSLFLQTGITANYFSTYQTNLYNPVLGSFTVQNTKKIEAKPLLNLFVNGQIRRTRLYLKAENILFLTSKKNYYSSPNQPYRDFTIRFGFVWNFFD